MDEQEAPSEIRISRRIRIELIRMGLDPDPILAGTQGIVESVIKFESGEIQLGVKWDNGRNLSVILPEDQVKIL